MRLRLSVLQLVLAWKRKEEVVVVGENGKKKVNKRVVTN